MAKTIDAVAFVLLHYPHKGELSNARVTKMLYLADWKHCMSYKKQITPISWYFDSYGPFVWDVMKSAEESDIVSVEMSTNMYGKNKRQLSLKSDSYKPKLQPTEQLAIKHVIDMTKQMFWNDFIKLVYSTYPIVNSDRYSYLDLIELAEEYKATNS
tara:strand:- start:1470 stop:1937 length:468 start_codon:yes stop_codon:yes gene_type:complete